MSESSYLPRRYETQKLSGNDARSRGIRRENAAQPDAKSKSATGAPRFSDWAMI